MLAKGAAPGILHDWLTGVGETPPTGRTTELYFPFRKVYHPIRPLYMCLYNSFVLLQMCSIVVVVLALSRWLYAEAKYATPMCSENPYPRPNDHALPYVLVIPR
jgi:hypothetical protein